MYQNENEQPIVDTTPVEAGAQEVQEQPEIAAKESWKQMRELYEQQKEENRYLREQQRQLLAQQQPKVPEKKNPSIYELPKDDVAMVEHLQEQDKAYQTRLRGIEAAQAKIDLRDEYEDFKRVTSNENINKLQESDPEFSQMIMENIASGKELKTQWKMVYNAIKRSDFYQKQNQPTEVQERTSYTATRPKPISAARTSREKSALGVASSFSRQMSQEEKDEIYKRAVAIANGDMHSF